MLDHSWEKAEKEIEINSPEQEPRLVLQDWRSNVLNTFLPLASLGILPSMIQTVVQWRKDPSIPWQGVAIFIFFYLILLIITLHRKLSAEIRSWIVVLLVYLTGVVSMSRGGMAGDGAIFLTVLPVLTITLINAQKGIMAAGVSISTFGIFGVLAYFGILDPWLIIHDNPMEPGKWLYYGLAMSTLIVVTVFVVVRFSMFQVETLRSVRRVSQALKDANRQLEQKVQERTKELSHANQNLQFLATHDTLTALPNRVLFFDRLEQTLKKSRRQKQHFALFFIDLDDFKRINDSFGHPVGDEVLKTVATFLSETIRDSDTVARLSGDEFVVILDNVRSHSDVESIAQKTLQAVAQPIELPEETVTITICMGISIFPDDGEDIETLIRKADQAMYQAKQGNKNSYRFYSRKTS